MDARIDYFRQHLEEINRLCEEDRTISQHKGDAGELSGRLNL